MAYLPQYVQNPYLQQMQARRKQQSGLRDPNMQLDLNQ